MLTLTRGTPTGGELTAGLLAGGGRARVVLAGELDLAGLSTIESLVQVVRRAQLPLTIDCRELTFIDCAGLGGLLRHARSGATLDGVQGAVRRLLDLVDPSLGQGRPMSRTNRSTPNGGALVPAISLTLTDVPQPSKAPG